MMVVHLHPKMSLLSPGPTLPSRADGFKSSLTEEAYKVAALLVGALNATFLLMAYQAELEEEMVASPDPVLWEELCIITDYFLQMQKVVVQSNCNLQKSEAVSAKTGPSVTLSAHRQCMSNPFIGGGASALSDTDSQCSSQSWLVKCNRSS